MANEVRPDVGDQFYVTHCATADSVLNNPGYTVRAASSGDRDALETAFRYPPYELPIDLWRDPPPAAQAPRRLARTADDRGRVWVAHSAYLAADSVGRARSYFSHLLLLPAADPLAVLRSWGAPGWATAYPPGAPKELPGPVPLPAGELVGDAPLAAFLGAAPPGPPDLATGVCPPRLRASAEARREALARVLHAVLLRDAGATDARYRLFVHAEPGLLALGLYAAVRLLPAAVTEGLTFSTFEPHHRNLREYKLADVIGTHLGVPEKGLDADLGAARGFALDTFVPARSSPELRAGPVPEGVNELLGLAARGEWHLLDRVRADLPDAAALPRAAAAVRRARAAFVLTEGRATIDDLLALKADPLGAPDLDARAEAVWKEVRRHLSRADVRAAFRAEIGTPERVRALWDEAVEAVLKEDFRRWDARWVAVREAAGAAEAQKHLNRLVASEKNEDRLARLPTDVRAKLRAACADVKLLPSRPLLVPTGLGELGPLLAAPPDHAGYTAFVLLAPDAFGWLAHVPAADREHMRQRAHEFLCAAPPAAVAAYVRAGREAGAGTAFLDALFTPCTEGGKRLMAGLLAAGALAPADWRKLCDTVRLTQDDWGAFLLEGDHLSALLVGLGGDGTGRDVWQGYLDALTPALLAPDLVEVEPGADAGEITAWERAVHARLRAAAEKLTARGVKLAPALPEGGVARLFAANALVKWLADPAAGARAGTGEVAHACAAFGADPFGFVRAAFRAGGFAHVELPLGAPKLEPLVGLFRAAFPTDDLPGARAAVTNWLRLSQEFPRAGRGLFQAEFVLRCVPDLYFGELLSEARQVPFDPVAAARIGQVAQGKVRPAAGAKGARAAPELPDPNAAVPVDEARDDGLPVPDDDPAPRKSARAYRAQKGRGGAPWLWVGALVALLVAGVAVAVIASRARDAPEPPKDEPKKAEPKKEPQKPDPKKPDPKEKDKDADAK